MRLLAIFLSLMHRIDFKLHILIILNDLDRWAVISPMLDHAKITKMPFWMIQNAKNEVFGHFFDFDGGFGARNEVFGPFSRAWGLRWT